MIDAIIEEIEIEASPQTVFEAWTDPQQLLKWWRQDELKKTTSWTIDLRPGGKWHAEGIKPPDEKFSVEGEYLRVEPGKYLSFTWSKPTWAQNSPTTTVEIEFHKTAKGTLVKLKHYGFTDQTIRDEHQNGWPRVLSWMSNYMQKKSTVTKSVH